MILDDIVEATKKRLEKEKIIISLDTMQSNAVSMQKDTSFPFERALRKEEIQFICEVKKASPSKGILAEDFPYLEIAEDYEAAGAGCISVLTEPEYFLGKDQYLTEIRKRVQTPLLRKDFIIDPYQIFQAKVIGADCILLICSLLSEKILRQYIEVCDSLGLSALVEAHNEEQVVSAKNAGARIIGVNNRNLKTFSVDINTCMRLRKLVPESIIFVAESGIRTADDINLLRREKIDAVLIGEALMTSRDKRKILADLRGYK